YLFFFSSRRRHTRFKCDWSSDVCSSDLFMWLPAGQQTDATAPGHSQPIIGGTQQWPIRTVITADRTPATLKVIRPRTTRAASQRSEERRVGKERRSQTRTDE